MYDQKHEDGIVDLGAASVETRGFPPMAADLNGIGTPSGLSDED